VIDHGIRRRRTAAKGLHAQQQSTQQSTHIMRWGCAVKKRKKYLLTIIDWASRRQRCAGDDNAVLLRRCGTTTKTTLAPCRRAPPRIVVIPPKDIVVRRIVGEVQLGALTDDDVTSGVVLHNVAPAPIVATRARRILPPPCRPPDPCPRRPRPPH
jgi:hypothetical protein